jgi:hypothetical protein
MKKIEVDLKTNTIKEVPLTEIEIIDFNKKLSESILLQEQKEIEKQEQDSRKESAIVKLKALGLTEEEVNAIIKVDTIQDTAGNNIINESGDTTNI